MVEYTIDQLEGYVEGLYWFGKGNHELVRLPSSSFSQLRKDVAFLATNTAGGCIRFKARTASIGIEIVMQPSRAYEKFSRAGQCGIDVYADGRYIHTFIPPRDGYFISVAETDSSRAHEYASYLPPYASIDLKSSWVDEDIKPPVPHAIEKPIVFYGSSITQGAYASRPGLAYPAQIGRLLDVETINLGFSGNGKCEPEVAKLVSQIDASCLVMDAGGNLTAPVEEGLIQSRYPAFLNVIRARHPKMPILINNMQHIGAALWNVEFRRLCDKVRQAIKETYDLLVRSGDRNVHYVDGLDMIGPDDMDCTADGTHANDLGFHRYVSVMAPVLKRILVDGRY
ncbi:MAG: SGNH/GDSL hydrolase family protein [Candidatus Sigynarchaeota archaeon]